MNLAGTDLNAAYFGESLAGNPLTDYMQQPGPPPPPQIQKNTGNDAAPYYDSEASKRNYAIEQQVQVLQKELQKQKSQNVSSPSLFSKFSNKKREIFKVLSLSLIILLALSLHSFGEHYLKLYILDNDFEFKKEMLVRLAYPLAVLVFIWTIKVLRSSD